VKHQLLSNARYRTEGKNGFTLIELLVVIAIIGEDEAGVSWFNSWHFPSGSVTTRGLKDFSKKAVAPVLFVDGHVKYFNLANHFRDNLDFPAEPTSDRIWYKAKE
jgi:prepilin-type N-terminal cleavage/methylation domain-containing protein/prepilin-type processing-associated H-X9-DG protein